MESVRARTGDARGITADNHSNTERKSKWASSYSNVSMTQTERSLGFRIRSLNSNDLAYATISPMPDDFTCRTGRNDIQLAREKEIVSADGETGGAGEFVVIDMSASNGGGTMHGFVTTGVLANAQLRWGVSDDREDGRDV